MDCVLCDVLHSHKDSQVLYEDEHVFIAMNIEPVKDGHIMILPVRHARTMSDLNQVEAAAFLSACDKAMTIVEKLYGDEGPMCMINGWKYRSQEHFHAHVLPSKNSLRDLYVAAEGTPLRTRLDREVLKQKSDQLRSHFTSDLPS
ncbi:MAG: HIT family protein [Patescibacteria group bacterium]|jgi:diadenosine tetraphosphate (Ap4A) HIT family hydrolase